MVECHIERTNAGHSGYQGLLTREEVEAQIEVLERACQGKGISFTLNSVDWTDDNKWFGMGHGSRNEKLASQYFTSLPETNPATR